jgi:GNAT superfamily N-acetyltransferase
MPTNIKLRVACDADFDFARNLYFETMRWIIERLFGWDEVRENKNFAQFFKIDEVKIITADDQDVGWIQEQIDDTSINLGSFYVMPFMQRRGIGAQVLQILLANARNQGKAITLAVVKINPAVHFYEIRSTLVCQATATMGEGFESRSYKGPTVAYGPRTRSRALAAADVTVA